MHSPDHSTKGTPSALGGTVPQWPLAACEYEVSGSVSSPSRGAFHLSLTVLVHYRSRKIFSLGGWSPQLPTNSPGFVVLRMSAGPWQMSSTRLSRALAELSNSLECLLVGRCAGPSTPEGVATLWFGLLPVRSPLLGESRLISARRATEMFQFTHCPPCCLCVQQPVISHHADGVAPFGISRLIACMQLPLNVSPVSASFFGLAHRGIHLVLSLACSRLVLLGGG